ncbi:addiction module RelE/StbE family toxin [Sphingomonas naasensis]|uniref:Type II toxin-antitoxin system RelE/ParE family toxin n=1 Tax=Sphingomonas naasensis TaxID=1344951 RepID=A0A4S1W3J0_9SPHN|nr:type II toxin-antitoxin system RelE/ParE family toxin [Sphingomonas naasensis]NIJ19682.1 addiction module RelE/StbE family toxin [Sphingomonas naasensis]TGX37098.1 type II toxin-antitoxin system RelE/ParE family toxin [Sphingomonas naasensis]
MRFPVVWRPEARQALRDIIGYIAERRPAAALRLGDAIEHTADRLPDHPHLHRPGRVAGTREAIVHPNYILVYRVTDVIEIVGVLHARQQYP